MDLDDLLLNYKGTLSIKDQKIFLELKHHDHIKFSLLNDDGYIEIGKWRKKNDSNRPQNGKRQKKEQSNTISTQFDEQNTEECEKNRSINERSSLAKFLRQFKQSLIKSSIFSFPLDIELNEPIDFEQECLDPRFLLLSFYHLINRRKITLEEFVDTNCLAITFVSLSFRDMKLRKLAYSILVKLKQNLCNDTYGLIWRILLDKFAASLQEENQLIQPIITSFLVHIIPFLKSPTYSIHEQLSKFLSNYSSFKFSSMVGFILSMLLINDEQEQTNTTFYQEVALLILKNGLKTEDDFKLCLHSRIIDFLLVNYSSSLLFRPNIKSRILDIFKLITKLSDASRLLCTEKAFLVWLNQLIVEENKIEILNKLNRILSQLDELNCDYYPLFRNELKMIKNVCTQKIDHLFEQDLEDN